MEIINKEISDIKNNLGNIDQITQLIQQQMLQTSNLIKEFEIKVISYLKEFESSITLKIKAFESMISRLYSRLADLERLLLLLVDDENLLLLVDDEKMLTYKRSYDDYKSAQSLNDSVNADESTANTNTKMPRANSNSINSNLTLENVIDVSNLHSNTQNKENKLFPSISSKKSYAIKSIDISYTTLIRELYNHNWCYYTDFNGKEKTNKNNASIFKRVVRWIKSELTQEDNDFIARKIPDELTQKTDREKWMLDMLSLSNKLIERIKSKLERNTIGECCGSISALGKRIN